MKLFELFLDAIASVLPPVSLSEKEAEELARLNPQKIYVENVRAILDVSSNQAERICETAVRRGLFDRHVEVLCPDLTVAAEAGSEQELPDTVTCWERENNHMEEVKLPTANLTKVVFYSLISDATTPRSLRRPA
jgi:hypothetical protein